MGTRAAILKILTTEEGLGHLIADTGTSTIEGTTLLPGAGNTADALPGPDQPAMTFL